LCLFLSHHKSSLNLSLLFKRIPYLLLFICSLLIAAGCGLRYQAPETPEAFEQRRHSKVLAYVRAGLGGDTTAFEAIAFGQTTNVRPPSFRKLDSLYAIKYSNEQNEKFDVELERIIEEVREQTLADTSKISYIEQFFFAFRSQFDSLERTHCEERRYVDLVLTLNHELNITSERVNHSILIPDSLDEIYKRFLFEESFLYPGSLATEEELNFYRFFKREIDQAKGKDKDDLTVHTLQVMSAAYSRKSLNTNRILYKLSLKELDKIDPNRRNESFSDVYSTFEESDKNMISGYWLTVQFESSKNGRSKELFIRFDHLYRVISLTEI
jgi:hypothetical protein